MNKAIHKYFLHPAAVLLFVLAAADLYAVAGTGAVEAFLMDQRDSLVSLTYRQILSAAGALELLLSAYLLAGKNAPVKLLFTAWLSTCLFAWRLGFRLTGEVNINDVLGDLPSRFWIPGNLYGNVILALFGVMALGGYAILVLLWIMRPKPARVAPVIPPSDKQPAPAHEGAA